MAEEMKKMLKEILQEELKEIRESASSQAAASYAAAAASTSVNASGKSKKPKEKKTTFDETRQFGVDERDPRASKETWPCYGNHPNTEEGNNRWGAWKECKVCGLRISYKPAVGAPGQYTQTNMPQNVVEALHRLRAEGFESNDLTNRQVKAMIVIVSKEKHLVHGKPKAKSKEKSNKGYPEKRSPEKIDMTIADSDQEDGEFKKVDQ